MDVLTTACVSHESNEMKMKETDPNILFEQINLISKTNVIINPLVVKEAELMIDIFKACLQLHEAAQFSLATGVFTYMAKPN